jgi:hypothetical protein
MTRRANTSILGNVPPQMTSIVITAITITTVTVTGVRVGDRVGVEVGVGPMISTRGATVVTGMTGIIAITAGRGVTVETAPAPVVNTTGRGGVGAAAESERDAHVLTRGTGHALRRWAI